MIGISLIFIKIWQVQVRKCNFSMFQRTPEKNIFMQFRSWFFSMKILKDHIDKEILKYKYLLSIKLIKHGKGRENILNQNNC